jgi:hypothetical protein
MQDNRADVEQTIHQAIGDTHNAVREIAEFVQLLGQEQERITNTAIQGGTLGGSESGIRGEINTLKAQIRLLESRLPSVMAGRLGGQLFQSRTDVLLFVENHVPSNSFFLFHDVVTLMESLMTSHIERRDVLQEWYQSAKVGVNEASARHMASFRLVLPTVFGRTKEGSPQYR